MPTDLDLVDLTFGARSRYFPISKRTCKEVNLYSLARSRRWTKKAFDYIHWQLEPERIAVNRTARLGDFKFADRVESREYALSGALRVVRRYRLIHVFSSHRLHVDGGPSSENARQIPHRP